jgi:hypothetical protein
MKKTFEKIIHNVIRYYQKRRFKALVNGLPVDLRFDLMHDLMSILDNQDRAEKVRATREIFKSIRERLDAPLSERVTELKNEYFEQLELASKNVLVPDFPRVHFSVDHDVIEQKAKAKITLMDLEHDIMQIPPTKTFHTFAAILGIITSTIVNYLTITAKFGDFFGGNETLSTCGTGVFALVICVFEASSLYLLLHFLPRKYTNGVSRIFGLIGAIVLFVSVLLIVFSRTEMGASMISSVQDAGKVE